MKIKKRWIDGILAEANSCSVKLPWERGLRRQAMITRRQQTPQPKAAMRQDTRPAA